MKTRAFGALGEVSAISLGGGGIGKRFGSTTTSSALATIESALAAGINLIDVAPSYGTESHPREAERLIGEAFRGAVPPDVRVVTKVLIEDAPPDILRRTIRESLSGSLCVMRIPHVDILLLHSQLRPDRLEPRAGTLSLDLYRQSVRSTFEDLREEGLIRAWGITATGHPEAVAQILLERPRPYVIQTVTNVLDSAGSLWIFGPTERPDHHGTRQLAASLGIATMGIRAVQGGALTDSFDRASPENEDARDFERAQGFRSLAKTRGVSSAFLAYRYALTLDMVDTVVIGVKNVEELSDCVAAEDAGPLTDDEMREIEASVGRGAASTRGARRIGLGTSRDCTQG